MPTGTLIDTIYGKLSKFDIYKKSSGWGSTSFVVYKNNKYWKSFSRLDLAAEEIEKQNR